MYVGVYQLGRFPSWDRAQNRCADCPETPQCPRQISPPTYFYALRSRGRARGPKQPKHLPQTGKIERRKFAVLRPHKHSFPPSAGETVHAFRSRTILCRIIRGGTLRSLFSEGALSSGLGICATPPIIFARHREAFSPRFVDTDLCWNYAGLRVIVWD
jgi:hypothetical protein